MMVRFCLLISLVFSIVMVPVDASTHLPPIKVRPLPIGPIHRGFVKQTAYGHAGDSDSDSSFDSDISEVYPHDTYDFHVMGQGKYIKPSTGCWPAKKDPGCFAVMKLDGSVSYVEMLHEDFRIARTAFQHLMPGADHTFQMGYLKGSPDNFSSEELTDLDWSEIPEMKIIVPSAEPKNIVSFVYGSCARIGKIGPIVLWKDKVHKMLGAMADHIEQNPVSATMTLGDFPYMDALGELTAAKTEHEMLKRVEYLYATENGRRLMRLAPFHQMRDDHEWWNNSTAEVPIGSQARDKAARKIYDTFQRPQGAKTKTNYQIIDGDFEAFMCDTRSERLPHSQQFMGAGQMEALKAWLSDDVRKDRIKPVFFSGPVLMLQEEDTFWEYPKQLYDLMTWIKEKNIQYIFFGTGDIHTGKTGLWQFDGEGPYILEDASSAFHKIQHSKDGRVKDYFMMGGMRHKDVLGGIKETVTLTALGGLSPTVTDDHFTRVTLNHEDKTVRVSKYNRDNNVLFDVGYNLQDGTYDNYPQDDDDVTPKYTVTPRQLSDEQIEIGAK